MGIQPEFDPNDVLHTDPRVALDVVAVDLADLVADADNVLPISNPSLGTLLIMRLIVRVTTAATGAATLDAGVSGDGSASDNLIDGLDVNAATGLFDNLGDGGTNGENQQVWGPDDELVLSEASGDVTGLEGTVYAVVARIA